MTCQEYLSVMVEPLGVGGNLETTNGIVGIPYGNQTTLESVEADVDKHKATSGTSTDPSKDAASVGLVVEHH